MKSTNFGLVKDKLSICVTLNRDNIEGIQLDGVEKHFFECSKRSHGRRQCPSSSTLLTCFTCLSKVCKQVLFLLGWLRQRRRLHSSRDLAIVSSATWNTVVLRCREGIVEEFILIKAYASILKMTFGTATIL